MRMINLTVLLILLTVLTSCKTTEYIYPEIPESPVRIMPIYPKIVFVTMDINNPDSDALMTKGHVDQLFDYIVSLREYAFLLEIDILYYKDITDFQGLP
jgi:hypothetical protein